MKSNLLKSIFISLILVMGVNNAWAANITGGTTLYLKPNSNWTKDGARFAAYLCNGSSSAKWYSMSDCNGDGIYEMTVNSSESHKNVIFCRMNGRNQTNGWDNKWNQTSDLTWDGTKNQYTVKDGTWDKGGGTWSAVTYSDKVVYLKPNSNWKTDNAQFMAYAFDNCSNNEWISMTEIGCAGDYYTCTIPAKYNKVIFARMNPERSNNNFDNNVCWNKTNDLTTPKDDKVLFTVTDWRTGSWGTYSAPQYAITIANGTGGTVTVKQGANTITSGNEVNLNAVITATLAANDGYSKGTAKIKIGDNAEADLVEGQEYTICGPTKISATWKPDSHTVTFDANGHGTAPETQTVDYNAKAPQPADPTETGYTFGGWYKEPECTNKWNFNTDVVTTDITLYANWTINSYTVTWKPNGGNWSGNSTNIENTYTYGANIEQPSDPSRIGYEFNGWKEENAAEIGIEPTMPDRNLTYIAQWEANSNTSYVVKHYKQNLDGSYPQEATETETFTGTTGAEVTPAVKSYEGFTAPATQTCTIAATGNLIVTYLYTRNSYQLTWNLDGGEITNEGTAAGQVKFETPLTAPTVEKTGYTFAGWDTEVASTMPATITTYTAKWTANTYTVTFNGNGATGSMEEQEFTYGSKQTLTKNGFTYGDYVFLGWSKEEKGTVEYTDQQSVSNLTTENDGKVVLYAIWATPKTIYLKTVEGTTDGDNWFVVYGGKEHEMTLLGCTGEYYRGVVPEQTEFQLIAKDQNGDVIAKETRDELVVPDNSNMFNLVAAGASGDKIFFKPNSHWKNHSTHKYFVARFWTGSAVIKDLVDPDGDGIYECEKPAGAIEVYFCLTKAQASASSGKDWPSDDVAHTNDNVKEGFKDGKNLFTLGDDQTVGGENDNGTWSTHADTPVNGEGAWEVFEGITYRITFDQTGAKDGETTNGTEYVDAQYRAAMPTIESLPKNTNWKFGGYYTAAVGGTAITNAFGDWLDADGYISDGKWAKEECVTLYAHWVEKTPEITVVTLNKEAFDAGTAETVTATPTVEKYSYEGEVTICWKMLDNSGTVMESFPFTRGDNNSNSVTFSTDGLTTGKYTVRASIYASTCGEGDELSRYDKTFTIVSGYKVTVKYLCDGEVIQASTIAEGHASTPTPITAPEIGGYKFVEWELGDGISSKSDLKSDTIEYTAIYDGYLTAKYEKRKLIFLDLSNQFGETEWTEPHIYLYSGSYWDDTNGTGGNHTNCIANGAMTRVGTSNIWYYDYESVKNFNGYVAFTPTDQSALSRFKDTEAIYRYDFSSGTPVFVPAQGQIPHSANQVNKTKAQYYNKGHWTKYMGGTGYTLKIYNKKENERTEVMSVPFTGSSLYLPFTAIADLEEGKTYGYKIVRDNDKWYKNDADGTMTVDNHENWPFIEDKNNGLACGIKTVAAGNHTFTLTLNATTGNLEVSVDYPAKVGNYRILYTDDVRGAGKYKPSQIISQNNKEPLVSFFVRPNNNPELKVQKATLVTENEVKWDNKVLYLKPNANWKADNARFAAAFLNNDKSTTQWVSMTSTGDDTYGCAIPNGTWKYVIFCRMNPSTSENNWDNKWNQTDDLMIPTDGKNCYAVKSGTWDKGGGDWSEIKNDIIDLSNELKNKIGELGLNLAQDTGSVFNIHLSNNEGTLTIEKVALYTGNYYIRVDAVDGKWYDYKTNPDNLMTYSAFSESDANSFGEKFSHYKTKWCKAGTNVKFVIANDYSHCISDTLAQDVIPLGNLTDEGTLLNNDIYDANIRFMWNRKTNKISRAYVGPTGDKQSQFLMLQSCSEFKDAVGNDLDPNEGDILDKENDIYAARFTDTQNWIYERTIQVKPRTRVKLYASYPNGYHIYIENNTGWKDVALYAFKDGGGEPLGNWPGIQPTRTVEIEGKTYYDFPVNKYVFGSNLIFNDTKKGTDGGQQKDDYQIQTIGDYYLTASSSNSQLSRVKFVSTTVEAKAQYFRGEYAEGSCADEHTIQILGGEGETWNTIRVIYDFKTNRLMAAWMPNNNEIDTVRSIESDVMIIRDHQNPAQCITFANDSSKLTKVKTVYGVMRFNRWILNNRGGADNLDIKSCTKVVDNQTVYDPDTTNQYHPILEPAKQTSQYERALYFISFPFDVHLSDVFGFGTYGQHWIIEYYDGLKRAKEGYWIDSDPNWKYVTDPSNFVLEKYKGYILCLNLGKMAYDNTDFWAHNISQVELFFPSTTTMEEIAKAEVTMPKLGEEYLCKINRGNGPEGDRRVKDSYWRCIGVPSYANYSNVLTDSLQQTIQWQTNGTLPFLYKWNKTDNTLTPQSTTNFKFETMHAYLVQNGGEIHWSAVNATPDKPNAGIIAKVKETTRNYEWRITLTQGEKEQDQAFVRLSDDEQVTTEFDFNQDLSKEFNYGRSDIYTLIGYEKAAANSLPISEQTTVIPLGLSIEYNGDYTLAMPDRVNGIGVTLVDNQTGTRTNLSAGMDYTLTLKKGDYNNRFYIEISPVQQVPTDIEYVTGDSNSQDNVRKVLIDNILYIVRDGQIFDARGARVK